MNDRDLMLEYISLGRAQLDDWILAHGVEDPEEFLAYMKEHFGG